MAPVNSRSCCKLCDGWLLSDGVPKSAGRQGAGDGPLETFQAFSQGRPPAACSPHPAAPAQGPGVPRSLPSTSPGRRRPHGPAPRPRATPRTARLDGATEEPWQFVTPVYQARPHQRHDRTLPCLPSGPGRAQGAARLGPSTEEEAQRPTPRGPSARGVNGRLSLPRRPHGERCSSTRTILTPWQTCQVSVFSQNRLRARVLPRPRSLPPPSR